MVKEIDSKTPPPEDIRVVSIFHEAMKGLEKVVERIEHEQATEKAPESKDSPPQQSEE